MIARSAPFATVYWRDVVSTNEVRSWFKLGRGSVYAIFLNVSSVLGKISPGTLLRTTSIFVLRVWSCLIMFSMFVPSVPSVLSKNKVVGKNPKLILSLQKS